jgi:hypothetical protein
MVTRRADCTECGIDRSTNDRSDGAKNSAGRECGSPEGLPDGIGISFVERTPSALAGLADEIHMALCMNSKKLLRRGRTRFQVHELLPETAFKQMTVQPPQPIRALWMSCRGHMLKKDITGTIPDAFSAHRTPEGGEPLYKDNMQETRNNIRDNLHRNALFLLPIYRYILIRQEVILRSTVGHA